MKRRQPPITEAWRGITFTRRALVVGGAQAAVGVALGARMAYISIVDNDRYVLESESNRVNLTLVPPRRGWIVDRHGKALANNRVSLRIDIIPDRLHDKNAVLTQLRTLLRLDGDTMERIERDLNAASGFQPVAVKEDVSEADYASVLVRLPDLPGPEIYRRLAEARGISLADMIGSGPEGAIVYGDVARALVKPAAPAAAAERKRAPALDLDAMRVAIAAAMARSKREIPHYYLSHQIDVTPCEHWLAAKNADLPPDNRLLIGALTVKATALAAKRFPAFNGFYRDNTFEPSKAIHVGVAIAIRGGGLAAPALHDADQLSLDDLMTHMRDLVTRTRAGRIRSSEIADSTITVTSLGDRGVETLYGIIYPPQVAIVGFGKVVTRPWVVDGAIGPRSIVTLTLSADHRVSDGHAGALFLAEIGKLLEEPDKL